MTPTPAPHRGGERHALTPPPATPRPPLRPLPASARPLQVSHLAPYHAVTGYRWLVAAAVAGGLGSGAALGSWGVSLMRQAGSDDATTGVIGAINTLGGLVTGTLIPLAAARAWQWGRLRVERARLGASDTSTQLERLLDQARRRAPLTDAGLRTVLRDIDALGGDPGDPLQPAQLARALASLAPVAMAPTSCRASTAQALRQLAILVQCLADASLVGRVTPAQRKEALLTMADQLGTTGRDAGQQAAILRVLLQLHDVEVCNETIFSDPLRALPEMLDLLEQLRQLPGFEGMGAVLAARAREAADRRTTAAGAARVAESTLLD